MTTTIQIEESTRAYLKAAKRGGETYDQLILRLLFPNGMIPK